MVDVNCHSPLVPLFLSGSPNADMSYATIISVRADTHYYDVVELLICPQDADQSCAQCGTQGVQLVPLQREVRSLPLDQLKLMGWDIRVALAGRSNV